MAQIPLTETAASISAASETPDLSTRPPWVVCLCAAWCRACDEYQPVFAQAATQLQAHQSKTRMVWLDIEDHADVVGDLELDNFPSLLIADSAGVRFLGPITPQLGTLMRLVEAMQQPNAASTPHGPETRAIVDWLASV